MDDANKEIKKIVKNDLNRKIKKIAKKAVRKITDELMIDDWFLTSSTYDVGCYERELKAILKKACKNVVKNGYKKDMITDVIEETKSMASITISNSIWYDNNYYNDYKNILKPHIKKALKSCDKLHESKKLYESSDLYTKLREIQLDENHDHDTTSDGVTEKYFGIFSNVMNYGSLDADQIGIDEEYEM